MMPSLLVILDVLEPSALSKEIIPGLAFQLSSVTMWKHAMAVLVSRPQQPLAIPERPWKHITMDFIVKLPLSHGYDSIWVVCDHFTRAAHFIPCRESMTAADLGWLDLDRIFRHHGLPNLTICSCGALFVSNFWKALMKHMHTDIRSSTAYHSQTDGLTERTNQTLETYLRAYCLYQQDDWVDYLPVAEFSFNNLENSSTKQTPFFANLAYHPTFALQLTEPSNVPAATDFAE